MNRKPSTPLITPHPVLTRALTKQVQEDREAQRDLATKFGLTNGEPDRLMGVGPEYVHAAFNRSLSRLGVQHVDLYHSGSHRSAIRFSVSSAALCISASCKVKVIMCEEVYQTVHAYTMRADKAAKM